MPPRSNPTARQIRLGVELRKLREQAGLTARAAAGLLGADQAQMSNVEAGRAGVSAERVRSLASHYACDDAALVDALVAMALDRGRGWWNAYEQVLSRAFLDLSEAEFHARFMHTIRIVGIPGLLQTEAHARAVFSYAIPELPSYEVDARVAHRMQRRLVFEQDPPPEFVAVVHEAALRMPVGGRKACVEQLDFLMAAADAPQMTLRVLPFAVDEFAGTDWSMLYLGGRVRQLDTVQLDNPHHGLFLDAEAQLRRYRAHFAKAQELSLGPRESQEFIRRLAREL
jgi:transcriptional regulator with XRE-family HTH domain